MCEEDRMMTFHSGRCKILLNNQRGGTLPETCTVYGCMFENNTINKWEKQRHGHDIV